MFRVRFTLLFRNSLLKLNWTYMLVLGSNKIYSLRIIFDSAKLKNDRLFFVLVNQTTLELWMIQTCISCQLLDEWKYFDLCKFLQHLKKNSKCKLGFVCSCCKWENTSFQLLRWILYLRLIIESILITHTKHTQQIV